MRTGLCASCGKLGILLARGLHDSCYHRHRRSGDLEQFPSQIVPSESVQIDGITYRQLDYWARAGYLKPERNGSGSGVARIWSDEEIRVARTMAVLVDAGLLPAAANRIARGERQLAPGVTVLVDLAAVSS